ncbi:MAG: putative DNA binding domain-containing protein [bacterium]|nr:putative DNA binding domain-containing protein [bacterium]
MPNDVSGERYDDLLVNPREDLDFEIKNWLDLTGNNDDKATLAKAVIAIANHGGGIIALGLEETGDGVVEAQNRPETLDRYSQDVVNGIVHRYCDPPFHCRVHVVPGPEGGMFPLIRVPGGHGIPVLARRDSPNGTTLKQNAAYIRKPGPRSETPQSAHDWKALLVLCPGNN